MRNLGLEKQLEHLGGTPRISPLRGRGGSADLGRGLLVMPLAEPLWVGKLLSLGKNGAGFQEQRFDLCNRARGYIYLLGTSRQFISLKQ